MYAKNLTRILGLLCQNSDVSYCTPQELDQRFESMRRYDQLGRKRRDEKLSGQHIAAAVFGLVPTHPGWAGHGATILNGLRPVGGADASFCMAETISDVVVVLLKDEEARKSFIRMTLTIAETGMNSNGGAEVVHLRNGHKRRAYFVPKGAVSLLSPGREVDFDPDRDRMNAPAMREISFTNEFFRRLARECELAERFPAPPEGDGSEYDAEEAEQERYRKLGVRNGSRFLHVGQTNFEVLRTASKGDEDISRFLALCGKEPPHKYIHDSCRIAVAYAGKHSNSDPDDAHEIIRLHTAARVMHMLARRFIKQEFAVSDAMYSAE
jgi:hypothetical protein